MDKLIESFLKYGLLPTMLLVAVFLIVQDPNRAYKLKTLILSPFFKLFKWFKREYVASQVSSHLNEFFRRELKDHHKKQYELNFKIDWVKTDEDLIMKSGKLVIRMRREEDQTKNILTATKYALPRIICPLIRSNIHKDCASAIDLAYMQKLANKLGNHGKIVFKKYFLEPEIETNPSINELLKQLNKIDSFGIFTTIFINELEHIGEGIYADSDKSDKTNDIFQFVKYLTTIADREIGEEIELCHLNDSFKVGTILLAKAHIASKKGLIPYLKRLNINLDKGCDSIYIVAFPPAFSFLRKFTNVVKNNERINLEGIFNTQGRSHSLIQDSSIHIACLRRNKLFTKDSFLRKLDALDLKVGMLIDGEPIDVSTDEAIVNFLGIDGIIKKLDCSWYSYKNCNDVLIVGEVRKFIIKSIDKSTGIIHLSHQLPETNPWTKITIPNVGDELQVEIVAKDGMRYKAIFNGELEVAILVEEISWFILTEEEREEFLNKGIKVRVTSIDKVNRLINCSHRNLTRDPWPEIHQALPPGKEFNGKVNEVNENFVRVKIDGGYMGIIPRESLEKAGFEYANYKENLVVGQGIEVVVTKVFLSKKKIRLDLKRNLN